MKNKFPKVIILFIAISIIICSCAKNEQNSPLTHSGNKAKTMAVYNDVIYFFDGFSIYCTPSQNREAVTYPVCSDSLCSHQNEQCPLYLGMQPYLMAIDYQESAENDGYPIIYVSSNYVLPNTDMKSEGFRIIRYDTKSNKSTTILSKIPNPINCFYLYGDKIFYTQNDGDEGYNIYCTDKTTKNSFKLSNSKGDSYTIIGATESHIYYNDLSGNIYRATHELDDSEFVTASASVYGSSYIYDNCLYYASDVEVSATMGKTDVYTCTIYKKALSDISSNATLLFDGVLYNGMPYFFVYDKWAYYCLGEFNFIGEGFYYDIDNNKMGIDVYEEGCDKIYRFDLNEAADKPFIDLGDSHLYSFLNAHGDNIIIGTYTISSDLTEAFTRSTNQQIYNIKNKIFKQINP